MTCFRPWSIFTKMRVCQLNPSRLAVDEQHHFNEGIDYLQSAVIARAERSSIHLI